MKVLIITENTEISSKISAIAKTYGADTIVYKWFLKALDNIEEIQPDLIILNSCEYPRLWKTLVQFVKSGIGGENVGIYLYEEAPLSAEDQKKYSELGINGYFKNITKEELYFLNPDAPLPAIGQILLSMPESGKILSGKLNSLSDTKIKCTLDFTPDFSSDEIPYISVCVDKKIKDYSARIIKYDKSKKSLILEVC